MASEDEDNKVPAAAGKISVTAWFAVMIVLTLIAGAGGGGFGLYLASQAKMILGKEGKEAAEAVNPTHITNANVRELPPIITNLCQPSETWVRLHAAIIFDPAGIEKPDIMLANVSEDILGFMQTLSLAQLSGASGLQHLREDLNDRAIVRSDGKVRQLIIESLVVQ